MSIVWKDVKGYEDILKVSSCGKVWSKRTSKVLKQTKLKSGYLVLNTRIGGRQGVAVSLRVHRLVAEAHLDEPSDSNIEEAKLTAYGKVIVNHKDGNKINNDKSNLEWCSYSENSRHAFESGLHIKKKGIHSKLSKFNEDQIKYIKSNPYNLTCRELADSFNVSHSTIVRIKNGERYA